MTDTTTTTTAEAAALSSITSKSPFFHPGRHHESSTINKYRVVQQRTPSGKHIRRAVVPTVTATTTTTNTTETISSDTAYVGQAPVVAETIQEHKSPVLGAASNLVNAIVGAGIVGIPYAIKQSGFVAGIVLIIGTAMITDKSLRLLIGTAKHVHVPTYETAMEVAFGRAGFHFTAWNMFIVAYGAMISYLMIVKDTFSTVLGIDSSDTDRRRALLFCISLAFIVPLASQRDMADLAKTSRVSVFIDLCLVVLIAVTSIPKYLREQTSGVSDSIYDLIINHSVQYNTIFIGIGVLSFAYVCQHAAFVIAGSLHQPTMIRWSMVTRTALSFCSILCLVCGVTGYIGYQQDTSGNILNNLDSNSVFANIARCMLGICMLFVYPLECFVARHVMVVLCFTGRAAHEGDDTTILNRRDRRIALTITIYILTVIPAMLLENMGTVFALTGAIGGSCLSYIGPGMLYLGIHGTRFLELLETSIWFKSVTPYHKQHQQMIRGESSAKHHHHTQPTIEDIPETLFAIEHTPLVRTGDRRTNLTAWNNTNNTSLTEEIRNNWIESCAMTLLYPCQVISWYVLWMPIWCTIANYGQTNVETHIHDMALKSPHPIRIGDVYYNRVAVSQPVENNNDERSTEGEEDDDDDGSSDETDFEKSSGNKRRYPIQSQQSLPLPKGKPSSEQQQSYERTVFNRSLSDHDTIREFLQLPNNNDTVTSSSLLSSGSTHAKTVNDLIGQKLYQEQLRKQEQRGGVGEKKQHRGSNGAIIMRELEPDPQHEPPEWNDYFVAIILIIFGVIAMFAGLYSIRTSGGSP